MKNALLTLIGVGMLVSVKPAFSQDATTLRNDPTYSTHNYKHANKAQIAQRWETRSGLNVPVSSKKDVILADYKPQHRPQLSPGSVAVSYKSSNAVSGWNYKTQRAANM